MAVLDFERFSSSVRPMLLPVKVRFQTEEQPIAGWFGGVCVSLDDGDGLAWSTSRFHLSERSSEMLLPADCNAVVSGTRARMGYGQ
jgi:hypothetical protein